MIFISKKSHNVKVRGNLYKRRYNVKFFIYPLDKPFIEGIKILLWKRAGHGKGFGPALLGYRKAIVSFLTPLPLLWNLHSRAIHAPIKPIITITFYTPAI